MPDTLIIGGGISGLLTAREFAARGASVTLLERRSVGREASWAGGGILSPLYPWRQPTPITRLALESMRLYKGLAGTLAAATGIDPEWTQSGLLVLDTADDSDAERWCREHALHCERPDPAAIIELASDLNCRASNPLWLPTIAHIRNPRLLKALHADLLRRGVTVLEQYEVSILEQSKGRITGVKTRAQTLRADRVIVTAGAWSGRCFSGLFPNLDIAPIKGQMIAFAAQPGLLRPMILEGGRYLIPRRDGLVLAGSTVEQCGFDKRPTAAARNELERFACALLPPLGRCHNRLHWAGLRPATPSGIPYIGRHPSIENLGINCGHFRNGLVMGPAAATLIADIMLDRPTSIPADAYGFDSPH